MADRTEWQRAVEPQLRALGREIEVPPASDLTAVVRQRLQGHAGRRRHVPAMRAGALRRRPVWRAALVVAVAVLAVPVATPQRRAVVSQVPPFSGIELPPAPGPARPPGWRA